ncbi:MAG: homogentisate phytyltransferase [Chloroflexales bacterium]|nr:homogentisate phytyltransferase [Chloroflexales bacterium]
MSRIGSFVGFSRPHTVMATSIQVITIFLIVVSWQHPGGAAIVPLVVTLTSCLAVNIYVVGLNQITDVAIDRINKPTLPLASGALSMRTGRQIITGAAALSLGLALISGPYLLLTVGIIFLIGTAYSLPPLRLKRFPIWAALSIAIARGFLANTGVALHYQSIFGGLLPAATLIMLGLFFFGFAIVIAIYKDIPDQVGDQMHHIQTFTTLFGPRGALALGRLVLAACYVLPIVIALGQLPQIAAVFLLTTHLILIALFWGVSTTIDPARHEALTAFYRFLWLMFYTEFIVLSIYEIARRAM